MRASSGAVASSSSGGQPPPTAVPNALEEAGHTSALRAGATPASPADDKVHWSAYRFHEQDPVLFHGGVRLMWRIGDYDNRVDANMRGSPKVTNNKTATTLATRSYSRSSQKRAVSRARDLALNLTGPLCACACACAMLLVLHPSHRQHTDQQVLHRPAGPERPRRAAPHGKHCHQLRVGLHVVSVLFQVKGWCPR